MITRIYIATGYPPVVYRGSCFYVPESLQIANIFSIPEQPFCIQGLFLNPFKPFNYGQTNTTLFTFSGSMDGLSVFKMEGVEQPVVRRKGGAKREKILHDPCFENTRRVMGEFGGRSAASPYLLQAFARLRPGHGTTGRINGLLTAL